MLPPMLLYSIFRNIRRPFDRSIPYLSRAYSSSRLLSIRYALDEHANLYVGRGPILEEVYHDQVIQGRSRKALSYGTKAPSRSSRARPSDHRPHHLLEDC